MLCRRNHFYVQDNASSGTQILRFVPFNDCRTVFLGYTRLRVRYGNDPIRRAFFEGDFLIYNRLRRSIIVMVIGVR
ncbi:hypothetical protein D3C86_1326150 [compost metagenome]